MHPLNPVRSRIGVLCLVVWLCGFAASSLWAAQSATLTWTPDDPVAAPDLAGYKVYRQLTPCPMIPTAPFMLHDVGNVTTYLDATIPDGTTDVCYAVSAYDTSKNESPLSVPAGKSFAIAATPGTPVLTVTVTDTSATVTWPQIPDGAGGTALVNVRYAPTPIAWGSAPSASCTLSPCVIPGLTQKTSYDFQAVAYRGTMNGSAVFGPLSAVVTATTLDTIAPPPPSNLTVTQLDLDRVQVAGLHCKSLKVTIGAGQSRVVSCLH